mgnify:CR=1 FL=1
MKEYNDKQLIGETIIEANLCGRSVIFKLASGAILIGECCSRPENLLFGSRPWIESLTLPRRGLPAIVTDISYESIDELIPTHEMKNTIFTVSFMLEILTNNGVIEVYSHNSHDDKFGGMIELFEFESPCEYRNWFLGGSDV